MSKSLYIHFPVLCEPHYISRGKNSGKVATINFIPNRSSLRFSAFLANGPRSLSRVKAGTHSPTPTGSHTAAHTPKPGRFGYGWYNYPRSVLHVHEPPRAGCQNGVLCRFWPWSDVLQKNAESLRNSDALMCVAVPRRRGPAWLRDLFRFCRNCGLYTLHSWPFRVCEARGGITTLGALCVFSKRRTAACQKGYPAILFVPRKSSEINPNSPPILIVPFPTFPGKAIHSGSRSEAGRRSLLMLFLVILRLVDIFPTI